MVRRHRVLTGERARSGQWRGGVALRAAQAQQRIYRQAHLCRREALAPPNALQTSAFTWTMQSRPVRQAALAAVLLLPLSAAGWALVQSRPDPIVVDAQAAGEPLTPVAVAERGATVDDAQTRDQLLARSPQRSSVQSATMPALELTDVTPEVAAIGHTTAPEAITTSPRWPQLAVAARAMPDVWHRKVENRCTLTAPTAVSVQSAGVRPAPQGGAAPSASAVVTATDLSPAAFGVKLAQAAGRQLDDVVIYTDRYASMSYPMGDVSPLYGVCSDVIIRAYRALGIDLQERIHEAKGGRGDRNIDHRRVAIMRRFFATFGQTLPITDIADDYRPGDIITYDRPQNSGSRAHVAIVSDERAPSGRPMIVHNRGWGPQLEDALFVDEITGHYRYDGRSSASAAMAGRAWPSFLKLRKRSAGRAKSRHVERASAMPARGAVTLKPKAMRRAHQFKERAASE